MGQRKLIQETTGLDMEQIEALKKGFEGFDKENSGIISGTAMQMIFKMMGVNVQVKLVRNTAQLRVIILMGH